MVLSEAMAVLQRAAAQQRLAHAYLITGPEGSGTRELTTALCRILIPDAAETLEHPDIHTVAPESKSRRIVIDQMRELERELQMRSFLGGKKVGIIFDADRLQPQAANAFLKTLEEPPAGTHLLLVSAYPDQLLETILSRCIEVPLQAVQKPALTPRQEQLADLLAEAEMRSAQQNLPGVFRMVRDFQRLLAEAKESAREETEGELKKEEARYKQIVDAKWLDEREEHYKALSEARYIRERALLIDVLEQWWADILRHQAFGVDDAGPLLDLPRHAGVTAAVAARHAPHEAIRRASALDRLREYLGSAGIQEALAIEVVFLNAFGAEG